MFGSLEQSRDSWKQKAQSLEAEFTQFKPEAAVQHQELEAVKKTPLEKPEANEWSDGRSFVVFPSITDILSARFSWW